MRVEMAAAANSRGGTRFLRARSAFAAANGLENQDGGDATLKEVVRFYADWSDHPADISVSVRQISTTVGHLPTYADSLVDFLENGLTDCRVEKEHAPFDHPSLEVPNGPSLPAVGSAGRGSCL